MHNTKILYISGSLGLGHITRDIAIANKLREHLPNADIEWLAADPATAMLMQVGEKLVPGAEQYANENTAAEKAAKGYELNIFRYLMKSRKEWKKNIVFFLKLVSSRKYDLIIGDETYEIILALREHPEAKQCPFVTIYDFVGLDAMTNNPLERLCVYYWNRVWSHDYRNKRKPPYDLAIFVGELEDIPDKSFGFMLPNRRELAKALYTFTGYIFPFDVSRYSDRQAIRKKLRYGEEPLIICSTGGTAIGKELLELCGKAFKIVKEKITGIRTVIVAGPRISTGSLNLPVGTEVKSFIPNLYEHFAACDLAIVQGGATSTFELTALRRPFIYFPIEGHCEQENVSRILSQRGAGIRMRLSETTPDLLSKIIIASIGMNLTYRDIPSNGAEKAALAIVKLLKQNN